MEYLLKTDDKFMYFRKKLTKCLIKNLYTNDKACGISGNVRNRQLSHILETANTHDTE